MSGHKIIIKLTTPWKNVPYSLTPEGKGIFGDYKFEIDNDCKKCDYWIVWGGLRESEAVLCPSSNVIYITDEAHEQRFFNKNFLNQFPIVFSVRSDLNHFNVKHIHELSIWHFSLSYDKLMKIDKNIEKPKGISIVSSTRTELVGHKNRFAFTHILMGHFKDRIDFYGRGLKPIAEKTEALLPYKYSIAIENSSIPDYFTEKINECFLTYTMPVYYGCPNISDFFLGNSLVTINIDDYKHSLNIIEELLESNHFEKNFDCIIESRKRYLEQYFLFPALIRFLKKYSNNFDYTNKKNVLIRPELHPSFHYGDNIRKAKNLFFSKIKRFR